MKGFEKYIPFVPQPIQNRTWPDNTITKAPIWCSVDLRDGNQALVDPMNVEEKLLLFHTLVDIGVKEIEVGFPSASETEFHFLRTLIEDGHIPDDVTIQVLVQARPHLIRRTFEAIEGCKHVIFHFYNSTSTLQRKVVFHTDVEGVQKIATDAATMIYEMSQPMIAAGADIRYEYSPESFMGTEMDAADQICDAVMTALHADENHKVILNLPTTVENCMPNQFADELEYFIRNLPGRERAIISLHPHNDRGTGVATAEMGLLAGADRIEATLFGNGERTGNLDMVTVAMNMYTQGIDPELDFSHLNEIRKVYEKVTKMQIGERQPYVGELVFTAFSGSHQDAINKGMQYMEKSHSDKWEVPYLPIDPADVGRDYEPIIRINSQSGKGGVGFVMEQNYGIDMPKKMREDFSYFVKEVSDHKHQELKPAEIYDVFQKNYLNADTPLKVEDFSLKKKGDKWVGKVLVRANDEEVVLEGAGNGQLNAVSNAVCKAYGIEFSNLVYSEHDLDRDSDSRGIAYFGLTDKDGHTTWGAGVDTDTITASIFAFMTAINRMDGMAQRVKFRALKSTPDTITAFKATSGQH